MTEETLAKRICELRKEKGWSQEVLALKCHVSQQAVAKWEKGKSLPDVMRVLELARIFGVELDRLITDLEKKRSYIRIMLDIMTRDFCGIFMANLDTGDIIFNYSKGVIYSEKADGDELIFENCYSDELNEFHKAIIFEEDYDYFIESISKDNIVEKFKTNDRFRIVYRHRDNGIRYTEVVFTKSDDFATSHNFLVYARDIDDIVRAFMDKN